MSFPVLSFHGAARTVTGSCMEVEWNSRHILVDYGMFQGSRTLEQLNIAAPPFDPVRIDAVLLTHAHIDHSGLLPLLMRNGFKGMVWCTAATRDLLEYMLSDSAHIQEADAERRNRRADRADEPPIEPLYTSADAEAALRRMEIVELENWFEPAKGFRARMWNAGHILGSASIELEVGGVSMLFSGDLGPEQKAFHPDPDAPKGFDHIICESTYGDRDRPEVTMEARRDLLEKEVSDALGRGGNLIIPVFAIERTQELLLDLARLINEGRLRYAPVFIDSPLASRATSVFAKYRRELDDLGDGEVFHHTAFHYVENVNESIRLNNMSGAIIMAGSGMCEGGRIRHHLVHNLGRAESTILFVGYQAQGTLGAAILGGAGRVRISGRDVAVRAKIRRIDSYSAHADQGELLNWITAREPVHGTVFLDHGEPPAQEVMATRLRATRLGDGAVIIPSLGESYQLQPGVAAKRIKTGRPDAEAIVARDWQNEYADFAANLKRELQHIENAEKRREALQKMRAMLQSYTDHRNGQKNRGQKNRGQKYRHDNRRHDAHRQ